MYTHVRQTDHPRMCVFPVNWQRWRSHHSINHSWNCHTAYKLHGSIFYTTTGAALLENNEASAKLTTANGRTFTWAQLDWVANHVTACSIGDWRALTWLAIATGWTQRKRSAICSGKLIVSEWFDTTWIGGTASRLYMCKSVYRTAVKFYIVEIWIFCACFLWWPWPWPNNLHIRTWPVSPKDVPADQKH